MKEKQNKILIHIHIYVHAIWIDAKNHVEGEAGGSRMRVTNEPVHDDHGHELQLPFGEAITGTASHFALSLASSRQRSAGAFKEGE